MKKILYLTIADSVHDQRFMQTLAESGYDAYALRVMSGDWPTPAGVQTISPMGFDFPLEKDAIPDFTRKLSEILETIQPDLVQTGPLHDLAYLAALSGARPLLAQSWGFDLMSESFANPENLARTKFALAHAQGLIVDANCSAEKAISLGFTPERIYNFPWGVDIERFNQADWLDDARQIRKNLGWENAKVLFCLRSWETKYGVVDLCKAFVEAAAVIPGLKLMLAGSGSQENEIRNIFSNSKLQKSVKIVGKIPNVDLPRYFAAADIYVSPSHVDGSSVSLMEALAMSLPVLVTDIPANLEWVQEGINGWVYQDGNIEDLTESILTASQAQLEPMGQAARHTALKKADWQNNKKVLLKAWQDLLNKD
jgi:glycosyltransferase involved in cell wall biosynthesis